MKKENDARVQDATGNAEALQKLELAGFSIGTQVWAFRTFETIAKNIAAQNRFRPEEWVAMESLAFIALRSDKSIVWREDSGLTEEQYLAGVLARKLRQAAARVADERAVWNESFVSLDACNCEEEGSGTLCDLVADDANLNVNAKFITRPRALGARSAFRRLKRTKDFRGLERLRQQLSHSRSDGTISSGSEGEDSLANFVDGEAAGGAPSADHALSVREVGYAADDEQQVAQTAYRARSITLGGTTDQSRQRDLKTDVREIMLTLPPKLRRLCRLMMTVAMPEIAYKRMKIGTNEYFRYVRPTLRKAFAELV